MLTERGKKLRWDTIALSSAYGGYHYGGCFSCSEILLSLYDHVMGPDDVFILSKGHSCWPWYVLLREKGLNPRLEGHPHRDPANGIVATTGSLGHGFPFAIGIAQAKRMQDRPGTVYVLLGDGECQEGTTWESLLIASRLGLSNLVVVVDMNRIQGSGYTNEILDVEKIGKVARMLGWEEETVDGHYIPALNDALLPSREHPKFVVARTVKGKGVSFMENQPSWHACWLGGDNLKKALEELS